MQNYVLYFVHDVSKFHSIVSIPRNLVAKKEYMRSSQRLFLSHTIASSTGFVPWIPDDPLLIRLLLVKVGYST